MIGAAASATGPSIGEHLDALALESGITSPDGVLGDIVTVGHEEGVLKASTPGGHVERRPARQQVVRAVHLPSID